MIYNLQFHNKLIPGNSITTVGPLFFSLAPQAADLDGFFECIHKFDDTLTGSLNSDDGSRFVRTYVDQISCAVPL